MKEEKHTFIGKLTRKLFLGMNGCIAEFLKLSEVLANGKESLQGALEEKKADPRSFKDDS